VLLACTLALAASPVGSTPGLFLFNQSPGRGRKYAQQYRQPSLCAESAHGQYGWCAPRAIL